MRHVRGHELQRVCDGIRDDIFVSTFAGCRQIVEVCGQALQLLHLGSHSLLKIDEYRLLEGLCARIPTGDAR